MQVYGVDLSVWLHARRYRSLLELINELPDASRLKEAQLNDPEYAEMIARLPEPEGEWSPRVSEYDLTAMLLREIREAVISVKQWAEIQATGKKPKQIPLLPAPRTEVDRARERLDEEKVQSLIDRLMPRSQLGRR